MSKKSEKYITLKEAAKISGYAPDYIGQLIRKGKLPGKQVYCTVAWMTTEKSLGEYMQKNQDRDKSKNISLREKSTERLQQIKNSVLLEIKFARLYKTVLYLSIILSVGFSLLLFYIFSVSLDNKLEQNAIERINKIEIGNRE